MTYMVMECHPGYAVVLSDDGRFLKVANMRYEVGQTVTNVVEMCLPQFREQPVRKRNRRWISSLAAMAACLVLAVTSVFFAGQMPYASVYLTINPEVRIDVNRNDVVVGVEGVNADGTDLLQGYDYKKKQLDLVMDELVDRAIDMGYLHEGGKITLTLDADEEWVISHENTLSDHLNQHLTEKISVTIDVENSAPVNTTPATSIVIPVGPEDYGESDYADDAAEDGDSGYEDTDDGQADYVGSSDDDGQTDYGTSDDDGQTDYGTSDDDGQSDYAESSNDDGQSSYSGSSDDDGQSNYSSDEGQSSYSDSSYDD